MKAVSPLVATAILLVVTVAGGILIYNYVINSLSSAQHYASLSIVSSRILILENSTIVNIRVSNIGSKSAFIERVVILPINITRDVNIEVEPGVTKSTNIVINKRLDPSIRYYVLLVYDNGETEPHPATIVR